MSKVERAGAPLDGRVFLGLREIAGYYSRLEKAFSAMGVGCDRVDLYGHPFAYAQVRPESGFCRWVNALGARLSSVQGGAAGRALRRVGWTLLQVPIFVWALCRHRYFVFSWGDSLLPGQLDLPLLRVLGKKTVFVFHGSDSRPPYLDFGGVLDEGGGRRPVSELMRRSRRKRRRLERVHRYADWVVDNPLDGHFHPGPFLSWFAMGMPVDEVDEVGEEPVGERPDRLPRILHSPSNPAGKGTYALRAVMERLREEGWAFEFVEITGRPHHEVLAAIRESDFVVDQLYSDTPLAGFAAEAAIHGKAAIVGIPDLERAARVFPEEVRDSLCLPEEIGEKVKTYLREPDRCAEAGRRAQAFMRRWRSSEVARRYVRLWMLGPADGWQTSAETWCSLYGWGLPAERSREALRAVVAAGGEEALGLPDKPALRAALLERLQEPVDAPQVEAEKGAERAGV